MANNRNMKAHLDKRRRRLMEFNIAKREPRSRQGCAHGLWSFI